MPISAKKFIELQQRYERLKIRSAEAQGELNSLLKQLDEEYACSSVEEADELLESLIEKAASSEEDFETAWDDFQKKWKEVLDAA